MNGFSDLDSAALDTARQMDPVVSKTIEEGTGWPCTIIERYASSCLLGFADRAVDARVA